MKDSHTIFNHTSHQESVIQKPFFKNDNLMSYLKPNITKCIAQKFKIQKMKNCSWVFVFCPQSQHIRTSLPLRNRAVASTSICCTSWEVPESRLHFSVTRFIDKDMPPPNEISHCACLSMQDVCSVRGRCQVVDISTQPACKLSSKKNKHNLIQEKCHQKRFYNKQS